MKSEVYFTEVGSSHFHDSILNRLEKLFDRAGAGSIIKENSLVGVKGHFGEEGNVSFVSHVYYRKIIDRIKLCGGKPFLTDTNTLYVGERSNSVDHTVQALKNGFSYASVGAPVIIADGLLGTDYVEVEINKKHIKRAKIASAIYFADALVVIAHAKMHLKTSYGGVLKTLGMGCASRGGKQEQHSGNTPHIDIDKCVGCGECIKWCNFSAMEVINKKITISEELCSGCGECIAVCRFNALSTKWDGSASQVQEKMVEYAYAVVKEKKNKIVFFNFVINVTPDCDCLPSSGKYIVPDIGILASFDPVAIDRAAIDLINNAKTIDKNLYGGREEYKFEYKDKDNFKMVYPDIDWKIQLKYAEELGLGNQDYELIIVK